MSKFKLKRRHKRNRRNNRKQFIIITVGLLVFVFILGTAYSAFSTNLSINASGEIIQPEYVSIGGVDVEVVTSGDGLYEDSYESGRYIYRGADVDNYITFNDEMWRIISVESDGTIKIIRNESIGTRVWNACETEDYITCSDSGNSMSDWSTSTLNTYLNDTYLATINSDGIVNHTWYIGGADIGSNDLTSQIVDEQSSTYDGVIGMLSVSEYIRANTNMTECGTAYLLRNNKDYCVDTNWLSEIVNTSKTSYIWLITPNVIDRYALLAGKNGIIANDSVDENSHGIVPVLYLSSSIIFDSTTDGSSSNPFEIIS